MAQTKRKRRTKHRGTAAGTIETRGRTGRPPSPEEKKRQAREQARQNRLMKPPTWRGSFNRAALASGLMFLFVLVTNKFRVAPAFIFAVLALLLYVPGGYFLEMHLYRRRVARQQQQRGPRK